MSAFIKYEEAGKAEKAGDPSLALELYREAHETFAAVQRKFPKWNSSLLTYRVNCCAERIQRLETGGNEPADSDQGDLVVVAREYTEKIRQLLQRNQELRDELDRTAAALEAARRESSRSAVSSDEATALVAQNKQLREQLRMQEQRIGTLVAAALESSGGRQVKQAEERLEEQLATTQARLTGVELRLDTYKRAYTNVKKRLQDLDAEQSLLARENAALRALNQTREQDLAASLSEANQLQSRNRALEDESRQLREQSRVYAARVAALEAEHEKLVDGTRDMRSLRESVLANAGQERELLGKVEELRAGGEQAARRASTLEQMNTALEEQVQSLTEQLAALRREGDEDRAGWIEARVALEAEVDRYKARSALLAREQKRLPAQDTPARRPVGELPAAAGAAGRLQQAEENLARTTGLLEEAQRKLRQQCEVLAEERQQWCQKHMSLLTRIAVAEEQRTRNDAEREALQKSLAQLSGTTDGQTQAGTGIAALQQRNRELERQIAAAERTARERDVSLQSSLKRVADLSALVSQLQATEGKLLEAQVESRQMREALDRERIRLAAAGERARQDRDEVGRLNAMLDALQTKNVRFAAQLGALGEIPRGRSDVSSEAETARASIGITGASPGAPAAGVSDGVGAAEAAGTPADVVSEGAEAQAGPGVDAEVASRLQLERDNAVRSIADMRAQLRARDAELERYRDIVATALPRDPDQLRPVPDELRLQSDVSRQRLPPGRETKAALPADLADELAQDASSVASAGAVDPQHQVEALVARLLQQGLSAEKVGDTEAAVESYKRVLTHDAASTLALQRLGLVAAEQGDYAEAERYLLLAHRQSPDDVDTLLPLGNALMRRRKPDHAVAMFTRAVALEPENSAAHRCLGIVCSNLGWLDAAEVHFRRAFELDESDNATAFNLAVLLATRTPSRMDEAREWYERALKLGSEGDPGLHELFGLGD